MIIQMPYGNVEINSIEEAIHFIRNRCNNCPHSSLIHLCSGYQAELCEAKEQELIEVLKEVNKNGWKEIK